MPLIKCHFKNLIKNVSLYESFEAFIINVAKEFEINKYDIKYLEFFVLLDEKNKMKITDQKIFNDLIIRGNRFNDIYCDIKKELKKIMIKDKKEMNIFRGKTDIMKEKRNYNDLGRKNINEAPKQQINYNLLKEIKNNNNLKEKNVNNNVREDNFKENNDYLLNKKMENNNQKEKKLMDVFGDEFKNINKQMNEMKKHINDLSSNQKSKNIESILQKFEKKIND
jgi:hypothetical protein